jgi:hypothetical protein
MSFNHLLYDTNDYKNKLGESVSTLDYILSPFRYEHADKRRHNLGLVGGPSVSHIRGNLVDLESDLRGQTRMASLCPKTMYNPNQQKPMPLVHQPSCQMQYYPKTPMPNPVKPTTCNYRNINN